MKIKDIITEAKMDPGIRRAMENKGYKFVGKGQDQDVYLSPYDGTIIKIFGTDGDSRDNKYSVGQQSVIDFIKFCQSQPNNPFLPSFGGFERFVYQGKYYLQISCERMFDIDTGTTSLIANELEGIANSIGNGGAEAGYNRLTTLPTAARSDGQWYKDMVNKQHDSRAQLMMLLGGEKQTMLLLKTIKQLSTIAKRKGYGFDLHSGNFMLGSDGQIVISDPFFTGTFRNH
jgi:hypothetical protein